MSYDISRFGAAAQKQILKKLRAAEAEKIARQDAKKGPLGSAAPTGNGATGGGQTMFATTEKKRIATGGAAALAMTGKKRNKLHAERTEDGYASKREAKRAADLRIMEKAGIIENLQEQVSFLLLPTVYARADGSYFRWFEAENKKEAERMAGEKLTLVEKPVYYVADFVYEVVQDGRQVVEDAKGFKDPSSATYAKFVLKRKMMLERYNIRVVEV